MRETFNLSRLARILEFQRYLHLAAYHTGWQDNGKKKPGNIYSPTFAKGRGSIAIGTRTVAGGNLSTSLGTLSFALANDFPNSAFAANVEIKDGKVYAGSTAPATNAVALNPAATSGSTSQAGSDWVGTGAVAIGSQAKAAQEDAIAIGNKTEVKKVDDAHGGVVIGAHSKALHL